MAWTWSILDKPTGSTAVLTSTSSSTPSFTMDKEGSYRIQLIVNGILLGANITVAAVNTLLSGIRLPAAGELLEVDPIRGWATAENTTLTSFETNIYTGEKVVCYSAFGYGAGTPVYLVGTQALANGQVVPSIGAAATAQGNLPQSACFGITIASVSPGNQVTVRRHGLMTEVPVNTVGQVVGAPVYLSASGALAFTPTTPVRLLGFVATVGSSGSIYVVPESGSMEQRFNVTYFGAKSWQNTASAIANITSGQHTLDTGIYTNFTAAHVGMAIVVPGAGASGVDLVTTIATFINNHQVTLTAAAGTTVSGANQVVWGTDCTAPIQAAMTALNNIGFGYSYGGDFTSFSYPVLYFPPGAYLITGRITATLSIHGDRAIIHGIDKTQDMFYGWNAGPSTVDGMSFRGGRAQLVVDNGDVSDITVFIHNCEFAGWHSAAVETRVSNSTQIAIRDCHFATPLVTGAYLDPNLTVFNVNTCDDFSVTDCWIYKPINGDMCAMGRGDTTGGPGTGGTACHFKNIGGVPGGAPTITRSDVPSGVSVWFRMWSPSNIWCEQFRFGGEPGASPQFCSEVTAYQGLATFRDNAIFTAVGSNSVSEYNYLFYGVLSAFNAERNFGDGFGCFFDPNLPTLHQQYLPDTEFIFDGYRDGQDFGGSGSRDGAPFAQRGFMTSFGDGTCNDTAMRDARFGTYRTRKSAPLLVSDLVRVIPAVNTGYNWGGNGFFNCTASFTTDIWGKPLVHGIWTATVRMDGTAPLTEANFGWTTGLKYLPAGTYTVVLDVNIGVHQMELFVPVGYSQTVWDLEPGRHLLHVPLNISNAWNAIQGWSVGFQMQGGVLNGTFDVGNVRIFNGRCNIDTQALELWSAGLPTTGQFWVGDSIRNSTPSPGGSMGWVCTTAGAAYAAPWAQSTGYVFGNQVLGHDGNVYQCVVGGTSLGTGTGPNNSTQGIDTVDNGVTWWQVGAPVVFKEFGLVSI